MAKPYLLIKECMYSQNILVKYRDDQYLFDRPYAIRAGCGKCEYCRKERSRGWILRLIQEYDISSTGYFCTFTYADENIIYTKNGLPTLQKKEWQNYMKRLRKNSPLTLKYYTVGEYGNRTQRPHYHAIMFNADINLVLETWKKGHVDVADISAASIAYVTGYVNKYRINKADRHLEDDRQLEFNLISQGIGASLATGQLKNYVEQAKTNQYKLKNNTYKIPKYIMEKLKIPQNIKIDIMKKNMEYKKRQNQKFNMLDQRNLTKWLNTKSLQNQLNKFVTHKINTL